MKNNNKKFHIGTGTTYLPGWINVDIFSFVKADIYSNAMSLPYERESFDMIYASHVLEHFNRHMILAVLSHWKDLLKKDGILRLAVPNFKEVCEYYNETSDLPSLIGLLYGGQRNILDKHYIIFDETTLSDDLKKVGFKDTNIWNWRETDHAQFDDYSQAYLPAFKKDTGRLMSLNLEAKK